MGPLISSANSQSAPRAWNRNKATGENDNFKVLKHNKYMINDLIIAVIYCASPTAWGPEGYLKIRPRRTEKPAWWVEIQAAVAGSRSQSYPEAGPHGAGLQSSPEGRGNIHMNKIRAVQTGATTWVGH